MTLDPFQHSPWDFWTHADANAQTRQRAMLDALRREHPAWRIGTGCFVSELASVDAAHLDLGDRSYVAAGAYLTGTLTIGRDVSVNAYTVVRGDVTIGDATRIGAHTSILGFNHTMSDPTLEIREQPLTSIGIRIGDDVWVGSHVVVLDGVTVGSKAVLAAGAVVTKDVPAGAVVGGNPARLLKWRVPPEPATTPPGEPAHRGEPAPTGAVDRALHERVARFGDRVRREASAILERSWDDELGLFVDRPGEPATVRAQCDAVELADLLTGGPPPRLADPASLLRGWQDPLTGRVGQLDARGELRPLPADDADAAYHVECVGYALQLLGAEFPAPLRMVTDLLPDALSRRLDALPWATDPWRAGHWVDALGTAAHWSNRRGDALPVGTVETLFGWLLTRVDARTGMWGASSPVDGDRLLVNGFYRASRGTLAQFGIDPPHPERIVDTVLAHARDPRWFAPGALDACNVLDVAHPLWLTRSCGPRADEVRALARTWLHDAIARWTPERGFAFAEASDAHGLQGTEMWLAIIWYLADLAGCAPALGYRPRGIHRPEPAASFADATVQRSARQP